MEKPRIIQCKCLDCQHSGTNADVMEVHLRHHIDPWKEQAACLWRRCKRKIFTDERKYAEHVVKHLNQLFCRYLGCTVSKPFRDLYDLDRHQRIKHSGISRFDCPFPDCGTTILPRVDKLLSHIKDNVHEQDALWIFPHCRAEQLFRGTPYKTRTAISEHYNHCHIYKHAEDGLGAFDCNLGSCAASNKNHRFSHEGLSDHLAENHGVYCHKSYVMGVPSDALLEHGLTSDLLEEMIKCHNASWKQKYTDCESCRVASSSLAS